ncbi:tetratricopeptide (TPR) repeat protein [Rhizobium sp. BK619]|uniref:tetratricopeptide repeat protein n=1 Tax=Rhizobium sp. BK619 TaxID=2586989 RepID=UPI00161C3F51|nr:tetratricopeptide repeat protein [Rhizobium sp. BK619]MBB3645866.1 tetratricopeptide (TPR) repeat protein [Rhizobium sp. BK619]
MMDALVSGSAARAVLIQGSLVQFVDADNPEVLHRASLSSVPRLLEGAHDIVRMKVKDYTECFDVLLGGYQRDRALRMLQIILENIDAEATLEAASLLETLLKENGVRQHVLNITYSIPYPDFPEIEEFDFGHSVAARELYKQIGSHQDAISRVRMAFDRIHFSSEELKCSYEKSAIHSGIFRHIVALSLGEITTSEVTFACIRAFKHLPDSREISTRWVSQFSSARVGRKLRQLDDFALESETYELDDDDHHSSDRRVHFQSVNAQIQSILERLDNREVEIARRFADQLIQAQLQAASSQYAAKSLSNLATEARRRGLHNLELEWAERAREVRPQDGWARALLGDTYLYLYRLLDAEEEFRAASAVGEDVYGKIGLARVAKESGNLDRALELFAEARSNTRDRGYSIAAWVGYCSTLREMWKPDETLEAFKEAKAAFPDEIAFQTGYARSLEYLGQLEEAKEAFVFAKTAWPGDPKGYCGEAEIYKHAGEFGVARDLYKRAVEIFPTSVEVLIGLADLHRKSGEIEEALNLYSKAQLEFPYEPLAHTGAADTQLDARDYASAIETYEKAVLVFGLDVSIRNGRANAYKRAGQFERSLQLYDQNVHDFPYSLPALNGRASLLKLLGKYDDALQAYDAVLGRQPRYVSAKAAKASALIAQGRFEEAEPLLIYKGLRTRNEWLTYHVKGMWHLKRGDVPTAQHIFSHGVNSVPFHRLRKQFQASLACCELQMRTYNAIPEYLKDSDEPIHVLLRGISFAFAGRFESAAEEVKTAEESMSPRLMEIKGHLDSVISVGTASDSDRAWLIQASEEAVLQLAA